jgi:hypothetical protein
MLLAQAIRHAAASSASQPPCQRCSCRGVLLSVKGSEMEVPGETADADMQKAPLSPVP